MKAAEPALRCRICEHATVRRPDDSCPRCDGPTDVAYDLGALAGLLTPARVAAGPETMWRYRDLLPAEVADAPSPVGWTPLVQAEDLSRALDVDIRLKIETLNPTGSSKDRTAAFAGAAAVSCGFATVCCASDGPIGNAAAAEARARGLEAIVLTPASSAHAHGPARAAGARVIEIDAPLEECHRIAARLSPLFPWGFVGGNLRPYAAEGTKTIAFEIAEQLGWHLPAVVVSAVASGTLFAKLAQGFHELRAVGLARGRAPRLIGAQASFAAPSDPAYGELALGAARTSGGAVVDVDGRLARGYGELVAVATGERADDASGLALAALVESVRSGAIRSGETVVLVVSGSARADDKRPAALHAIPPRLDRVLEELGAS